MADDAPLTASEREELDTLRSRLADLESERREQIARAVAAAAGAQERAYWLDRWQLDLNARMATPAAGAARAVLRTLRVPVRRVRLFARRLRR